MDVLTEIQLRNLKNHVYKATGTSILEPAMQVFWRWLVEQIPTSWAPNTLTLVGLALNVVSSVLLFIYSSDGVAEAPRLVYLFVSLCLFVYQSLDAIDGKQARRTKSNTPLGELFDHGCDSVSTVFVMSTTCVALRMGQEPMLLLFAVCLAEICFYVAHWQTYVSGTLKFGRIDVTEGQFAAITIHVVSFIIGPSFWDKEIPLIGPIRYLVAFGTFAPCIYFIFVSIHYILQGGTGKNKSTVAGTSTIFPAVPIGLVKIVQVMISCKSSVYTDSPCLFLVTFGLVSAKVTNRLVVAHMTKSTLSVWDSSLYGPAALFLNQYFNSIIPEYYLLWACFVYATYDLLRYSIRVCQQICRYLNIYCFNITSCPKPEKTNGRHTHQSTK
ncbi:hypothetical protein CHS0354_020112 [Potamilus streckersoni]|uniref:diacylglycerol cholinephosphotransferase n=1 Tax=Potamilus streckersoni TaxID=2493646 RepID=A0AAE0S5N8_9BIVA|nr:hypothetical protein CHS0354_020112 [Potamilus streckersoni]